jgi:hypothetical protein
LESQCSRRPGGDVRSFVGYRRAGLAGEGSRLIGREGCPPLEARWLADCGAGRREAQRSQMGDFCRGRWEERAGEACVRAGCGCCTGLCVVKMRCAGLALLGAGTAQPV